LREEVREDRTYFFKETLNTTGAALLKPHHPKYFGLLLEHICYCKATCSGEVFIFLTSFTDEIT
jgi:hypothetical protein